MIKSFFKELYCSIVAAIIISLVLYMFNPELFLPINKWDAITLKSICFLYLFIPAMVVVMVYYMKKDLDENK